MPHKKESSTKNDKDSIYIVLLGDCNVGKTGLIKKYINPNDNEIEDSSIGINLIEKEMDDNILKIIDTSGQERNKGITDSVYKRADAFIVVFDMNNKESFNNIIFWFDLIEAKNDKEDIIIYVVGNESIENCEVKTKEDIENLLKIHKNYKDYLINPINYIIVNLKTNYNIEKLFEDIINKIYNSKKINEKIEQKNRKEQGSNNRCNLF
jgi:small GTP-binding protein